MTSLFLFTFFILRAGPLKRINNPNTPYCSHCCHAGTSSSFEWISARTPCMFFLLKIVTTAFLLKRKSNHVTPAHHFPLYHPPKFLISLTVKSQSLTMAYSHLCQLHLSLLIPSLTHCSPTPLASLLFPAHTRQTFTLGLLHLLCLPGVMFFSQISSSNSVVTVFEVPVLTAIASSLCLGHLLHLTFFPPWVLSPLYTLQFTYYVYSFSHSLECRIYRGEDFCLLLFTIFSLAQKKSALCTIMFNKG